MALARACDKFTGAEIEAVFIDALHEALFPLIHVVRDELTLALRKHADSEQAASVSSG